MANIYWAATSTADWSTGASWTGGVKPGAGDFGVFTGSANGDVTMASGPETCLGGQFSRNYTGKPGTVSNRIALTGCTDFTYAGSNAESYFDITSNRITLNHLGTGPNACVIDANCTGGEDFLAIGSGHVTVDAGTQEQVFIANSEFQGPGPDVVFESGAGPGTYLRAAACTVLLETNTPSTIDIDDGAFVTVDEFGGNWPICRVNRGTLRGTGTLSAQLTDIFVSRGGVVDMSALKQNILINTNGTIVVGPGGQCNLDNGTSIINNGAVIQYNGSTLKFAGTLTVYKV